MHPAPAQELPAPLKGDTAYALTARGPELRAVAFHVIRFRVGFDCQCGRAITLTQEHEQHSCACGAVYNFATIGPGALAHLRAARA